MVADPARSDDDIMREAAGARPVAFAEIYERHHAALYGYLRKLVGTSDGAHDLTQETFLLAFKSRGSYRGKGAFQAWLYRIATNLARGRFRAAAREPGTAAGDVNSEPADDDGPVASAEAAETRRAVEAALRRLPMDQREVVLLRHFQGLRFRDIARTLDISESTAKSRLRYALEKLADMLRPLERELQ